MRSEPGLAVATLPPCSSFGKFPSAKKPGAKPTQEAPGAKPIQEVDPSCEDAAPAAFLKAKQTMSQAQIAVATKRGFNVDEVGYGRKKSLAR